ncbi:hypothetical protein Tsubulata_037697 [Turnera subulata]|uniref:Rieske domain-containing protein n=1 Tax=Turnera subulata TaxID=218843 RepID=A0A9Q0FPM8_9ROSI|nr:hypothetical protein Tsubulata_037697 [Turnera subulata]
MEALKTYSFAPFHIPTTPLSETLSNKPKFLNFQLSPLPNSSFLTTHRNTNTSKSKIFTAISPSPSSASTESVEPPMPEVEAETQGDKFDWYSQWYPVMPVCDLDKRAPHGKKVMGIDVVVWWDRNEGAWKVFDDTCPHRLAPLSEGRIDQWGRLQCVYHGWCFNGSGDCKLIPQAPPDGPPVHTFKKACAAVYPSTVHHDIVWFWPNTDPQYKDIITKRKPPFLPELDDPSFTTLMGNRDIAYGYDVLVENLMDPAHVPYAHYGLMKTREPKVKLDREGGRPMEMSVKKLDVNGFIAKQEWGGSKFIAPCIFYAYTDIPEQGKSTATSDGTKKERKIMDVGPQNWQKACFVPTKSDALVVGFRRWYNKYGGGEVDWRGKYSGALPPIPPREQLLDRYWSHVVNCRSCKVAHKGLNALEIVLQVVSVLAIGVVAATKQGVLSAVARSTLVGMAILCFAGSRWLAHFIHKNFHYHDYNHAFR